MLTNRRDDTPWVISAFVGVLILVGTFILKLQNNLDVVPYSIGLVVGAGLVSPNIIKGMIVKWRMQSRE